MAQVSLFFSALASWKDGASSIPLLIPQTNCHGLKNASGLIVFPVIASWKNEATSFGNCLMKRPQTDAH